MSTTGGNESWNDQPRDDAQQPAEQQYGQQNPYGAVPPSPYGDPAPSAADPYGHSSAPSAPSASAADPYGQSAPSAADPYGQSAPSAADPYGQGQQAWSPADPFATQGSGAAADPYGQPGAQQGFEQAGQQPYGQSSEQQAYGQQPAGGASQMPAGAQAGASGRQPQSRMLVGLLGIFLGGWGVHRFLLGYTTIGIIQIIVTIVTCGVGALWGFIEGIMILARAQSFERDAYGIPLTD